jgi:hypothetical protein
VLLLSAIGTLMFDTARQRRRAGALLLGGSLSNLLLDLPQRYADGYMLTNEYLFPLPPWRVPTPGWYVSADRWLALSALGIAVVVFLLDRWRDSRDEEARNRPTAAATTESSRTDD